MIIVIPYAFASVIKQLEQQAETDRSVFMVSYVIVIWCAVPFLYYLSTSCFSFSYCWRILLTYVTGSAKKSYETRH